MAHIKMTLKLFRLTAAMLVQMSFSAHFPAANLRFNPSLPRFIFTKVCHAA
jgi:hypothetical protein